MNAVATAAAALLAELSPALTTVHVVADEGNPELDAALDAFDRLDAQVAAHLASPSIAARLEEDFARCVPALADAAVPLESWAIPLLSALAGPCAPLLSFGLTLACKVALAALTRWAAKKAPTG